MKTDFPLESIRLAVLDLDGTLVDAFEDIRQATNHVLKEFGRAPMDLETLKSFVGNGAANLLRGVLSLDDEEQIQRAVKLWSRYASERPAQHARLYPGGAEFLRGLRGRGVRTAVLSNKLHGLTVKIIEQLGVDDLLDATWGERPEFGRKPDPRGLRALMAELGAEPEGTLMIGDGPADIGAAKSAGAWSCGVTWGLSDAGRLTELGADMQAGSFAELRERFGV